jgi:hypothetical protein
VTYAGAGERFAVGTEKRFEKSVGMGGKGQAMRDETGVDLRRRFPDLKIKKGKSKE